ncbi:hypothetical protein [Actinomadura kijaniata]|uniref:hypothetical protein n=1 Tax=Actinomadura kijaniata TaxID=46161 RepID=UPI000B0F3A65
MSPLPLPALAGLLDDAALFPPGDMPLPDAVPAHHRHHAAWYAELVGPLVFPAPRLHELPDVLDGRPIALSVTVPQGPSALAPALKAVADLPHASLAAVEIAVPPGTELADLLAVLDEHLTDQVLGYVEVPRDDRRETVLDALAGTRHRAKFRTGGLVPDAHPSERELAGSIHAAVARGVPFKCTAGLHHAVRHTDGSLEQHGFLNVLLATGAALDGASPADLAAILADRSPAFDLTGERLAAARGAFASFGTCSVADPVDDLLALGLITRNGTR